MSRRFPFRLVRTKDLTTLRSEAGRLVGQIDAARRFIKEIESGNLDLDIRFDGDDRDNALALSLVSMRDQMRKISAEEKERNWATEGLAKFVDILRSNNTDLKALSQVIVSNVVKYTQSNQGSLYIMNEAGSDRFLDLVACYAYDRKKHIEKRIGLGDGLVGQCVLEKETMYMTNLPADYLKITSGLGAALPRNLLIVPLMINGEVYGAIELASFAPYEKYHRDFIEKLAESIASTVSNVRVNEQTRQLLHETQVQTEQVRSQEEEMRQNMEELSATQEEMQRVLREVEGKGAYVTQLLNVSSDSVYTVDKKYQLVSWNTSFEKTLERFGLRLEKGMNTVDWHQGPERDQQIERYNRTLKGESFEFMTSSEIGGKSIHHLSVYSPLRNANDEIFEVAVFSKDMTGVVNAQRMAEKAAREAQNHAEELKAQEEELRQNMEELSSTQEEMQRVMNEMDTRAKYTLDLLNASDDIICTIDREFKLVTWNKTFEDFSRGSGGTIEKGFNTLEWYPTGEARNSYKAAYDRAFSGESFQFESSTDVNGKTYSVRTSYKPLLDSNGDPYEIAMFTRMTLLDDSSSKSDLKRTG